MRRDTTYPQKTNITSLAATTAIVVFAAWMANLAAPPASIYAPASLTPTAASSDRAATDKGEADAVASDQLAFGD